MVQLVMEGLPVSRICTHEIAAAEAQSAIRDFLDARAGKVVLRWD